MKTCHVCHQSWLAHSPGCRVVDDLARMHRVYERLVVEGRDAELAKRIGDYLGLFGNLPCQGRADAPTQGDCQKCGHKDICVIVPDAA